MRGARPVWLAVCALFAAAHVCAHSGGGGEKSSVAAAPPHAPGACGLEATPAPIDVDADPRAALFHCPDRVVFESPYTKVWRCALRDDAAEALARIRADRAGAGAETCAQDARNAAQHVHVRAVVRQAARLGEHGGRGGATRGRGSSAALVPGPLRARGRKGRPARSTSGGGEDTSKLHEARAFESRYYAVKRSQCLSRAYKDALLQEVSVLHAVRDVPNVTRYVASFWWEADGSLWVVTEWVGQEFGLTLDDVVQDGALRALDGAALSRVVAAAARDVLVPLAAMHALPPRMSRQLGGAAALLHADIKPQNVFLRPTDAAALLCGEDGRRRLRDAIERAAGDAPRSAGGGRGAPPRQRFVCRLSQLSLVPGGREPTFVLGDFGNCVRLTPARPAGTALLCTPEYASPEMLARQPYGRPHDVWALGATLHHVVYGTCAVAFRHTALPPYVPARAADGAVAYVRAAANEMLVLPRDARVSAHLAAFLACFLAYAPGDRWSAADLLRHPFILAHTQPADLLSSAPALDSSESGHSSESSCSQSGDRNLSASSPGSHSASSSSQSGDRKSSPHGPASHSSESNSLSSDQKPSPHGPGKTPYSAYAAEGPPDADQEHKRPRPGTPADRVAPGAAPHFVTLVHTDLVAREQFDIAAVPGPADWRALLASRTPADVARMLLLPACVEDAVLSDPVFGTAMLSDFLRGDIDYFVGAVDGESALRALGRSESHIRGLAGRIRFVRDFTVQVVPRVPELADAPPAARAAYLFALVYAATVVVPRIERMPGRPAPRFHPVEFGTKVAHRLLGAAHRPREPPAAVPLVPGSCPALPDCRILVSRVFVARFGKNLRAEVQAIVDAVSALR